MKITAVIGSSKQGHTSEVMQFILSAMQRALPEAGIETMFLSDYQIPFCTGCHRCIFHGEQHCPHHSSMNPLEEKLLASDGVILASPGYMFSVTGIMKNFLDHAAYTCHRPKYAGKSLLCISACTVWQKKSVFAPMKAWGDASGFASVHQAYAELLPLPMQAKALNKQKKRLCRTAEKFAESLKRDRVKTVKLSDLMVFKAFSMLSQAAPLLMKADAEYYRQFSSSALWHSPAHIPVVTRLTAKILSSRMNKSIGNIVDLEAAARCNISQRVRRLTEEEA